MEMHFCRRCGEPLSHVKDHIYTCPKNHLIFANPNPSVSVWLLNRDGEVLLTQRGTEPGKGAYDSPGGFVDGSEETIEMTIARELKEELGLDPEHYSAPRYLTSTTGWYEYKRERLPTLDLVFFAMISSGAKISPKDDVESFVFAPITDINPEAIYVKAVREGFLELRRRILEGSLL